jgi:hypothetical protein
MTGREVRLLGDPGAVLERANLSAGLRAHVEDQHAERDVRALVESGLIEVGIEGAERDGVLVALELRRAGRGAGPRPTGGDGRKNDRKVLARVLRAGDRGVAAWLGRLGRWVAVRDAEIGSFSAKS